jgi:sarcosine oxidase subunit gamma
MAELASALPAILGGIVPGQVGEASVAGDVTSMRIAPEQLWIVGREGDGLEGRVRAAVGPALGAVTSLSHSRARLVIEGECAREVLAKGVGLDLHPDVFGVHRFAMTGIHHTPALVYRGGVDRYDLYAMRTFARSVWEWLTDSALEYGYDVVR